MSAIASPSPAGFTPAKLGLIASLALVLVGAIVYQFGGGGSSPATYTKRAPRTSENEATQTPANNAVATPFRAVGGKWPRISVAEAREFDPFAFPEALASGPAQSAQSHGLLHPLQVESSQQSDSTEHAGGKSGLSGSGGLPDSRPQEMKRRLEEQQAVVAELQRRGVGMIFQTAQGSVARLGDLEVRVGDVLNGLRVVEINADGIRLIPEPLEGITTD